MGLPVYEHRLTVTDTAVTPQGPLSCGVAGDERAARLRFRLEAADAARYDYRLEAVAGDGTYDLTDWLPLTDGEVLFDIPSRWTAAGIAAVRLVRYVCAEDGIQTARQYYPPVLLQFAYREEGVQPTAAPLQWQELVTRAEAVLNEAAEAAEIASMTADEAYRSLEAAHAAVGDARAAAVHAEGAAADCDEVLEAVEELSGITADILAMSGTDSGIYHPCVTVDTALNSESDNPVANRAITLALDGKSAISHTHTTGEIGCDNSGYWWGTSTTLEEALTAVSADLAGLHGALNGGLTANQIGTGQSGGTVEESLAGLWATKVSAGSFSAEFLPFTYGTGINTVADALRLLLQKAGL